MDTTLFWWLLLEIQGAVNTAAVNWLLHLFCTKQTLPSVSTPARGHSGRHGYIADCIYPLLNPMICLAICVALLPVLWLFAWPMAAPGSFALQLSCCYPSKFSFHPLGSLVLLKGSAFPWFFSVSFCLSSWFVLAGVAWSSPPACLSFASCWLDVSSLHLADWATGTPSFGQGEVWTGSHLLVLITDKPANQPMMLTDMSVYWHGCLLTWVSNGLNDWMATGKPRPSLFLFLFLSSSSSLSLFSLLS